METMRKSVVHLSSVRVAREMFSNCHFLLDMQWSFKKLVIGLFRQFFWMSFPVEFPKFWHLVDYSLEDGCCECLFEGRSKEFE